MCRRAGLREKRQQLLCASAGGGKQIPALAVCCRCLFAFFTCYLVFYPCACRSAAAGLIWQGPAPEAVKGKLRELMQDHVQLQFV